jgi:hypothetical protein
LRAPVRNTALSSCHGLGASDTSTEGGSGCWLEAVLEKGDRETFLRLNPFLALLVEAAGKRR